MIHIETNSGEDILNFVPAKAHQTVVPSSADLAVGSTYVVYSGESSSGTETDGLHSGGLNFDAHVRRPSFTVNDLAEAHIIGMDTYAQGLKAAQRLLDEGEMEALVAERYGSWETGIGKEITEGRADFRSLEEYAIDKPEIVNVSGHQERFEAILNRAIFG